MMAPTNRRVVGRSRSNQPGLAFGWMTDEVTRILREAYDRRAEKRATRPAPVWETVERDNFLTCISDTGCRTPGPTLALF